MRVGVAFALLPADSVMSCSLTQGWFEYADLFGHEFEHIVEQIDRVNLAALTATPYRRDTFVGWRLRNHTRA
jgi:predicted solute-binding protein